ncbi:sensor histidine kinase [Streptomyces sp. NRRL WC-3618]|uniref:sensor histidine kinase n=1 Tax=Streptomyces sp. NRRL WC-3618 TaxID=1519490 RepID=UPI00131BB3D8|nr:histidine kinase [Streptomyces sp. NRRL WC-3618]
MQPARTAGEQQPEASPETPAQHSAQAFGQPSPRSAKRSRECPSLRPTSSDLVLLTVLITLNVVVTVWNETHREGHPRFGPWAGLGLQVVVVVVLAVRRVWPLVVLGAEVVVVVVLAVRRVWPLVVLGAATASAVLMSLSVWWVPGLLVTPVDGSGVWVPLAAPFAAYSAVVYSSRPRGAWVLTGVLTLVATRLWELSFAVAASGVLLTAVPALLGMYVAARRGLIVALTERAERAEREQFLLAERARAEERVRLAGEMHDVVTHRVSLMVLQAGALRVVSSDERVRAEAEGLRAAGCQALEELRDLVGVLRSPESAVGLMGSGVGGSGSGVGVGDWGLSVLVEECRAVGVEVELSESGDRSASSPVVARTAYRIVQEALTNVRKHAPGSGVRVEVRYEADRVRLRVRNSAPTAVVDRELASSGSGSGLKGLRQRVELVGGTFESGPRPDGGFGRGDLRVRTTPRRRILRRIRTAHVRTDDGDLDPGGRRVGTGGPGLQRVGRSAVRRQTSGA